MSKGRCPSGGRVIRQVRGAVQRVCTRFSPRPPPRRQQRLPSPAGAPAPDCCPANDWTRPAPAGAAARAQRSRQTAEAPLPSVRPPIRTPHTLPSEQQPATLLTVDLLIHLTHINSMEPCASNDVSLELNFFLRSASPNTGSGCEDAAPATFISCDGYDGGEARPDLWLRG